MYRHLLVPVDDTEISAGNVTAAVEFARNVGARITFFHANADYAATDDGALMHAMAPAMFAQRAAGPTRAILAKAETAARVEGIACRGISAVNASPARAILRAAESEDCDLIFMASRGPTSIGGLMLGSQTLKVLAGATIPVLVSSVAPSARHGACDAAMATIKDEHRSIAALLHALRRLVAEASQRNALDTKLVRAGIHYLRAFPEMLHHPKEERHIFRRLRDRSPELDRVLDELERQHAEGTTLLDAVVDAVDACERRTGPTAALGGALEAFTLAQLRHIAMEERIVLPAAREFLSEGDWSDIADAFAGNGDPRLDRLLDGDFRAMFARIMNRVPAAGDESSSSGAGEP